MDAWRLIVPHEKISIRFGMALDEALIFHLFQPVLHIYGVSPPGVSIGYSTPISEVPAFLREGRELVRRPTGGGIVLHDDGLVFGLAVQRGLLRQCASPRVLHKAVAGGLRSLGLPVELAPASGSPAHQGQFCSKNIVKYDILLDGRKVGGSARRHLRRGILVQGYVERVIKPAELARTIARGVEEHFGVALKDSSYTSSELRTAEKLFKVKYSTPDWLLSRCGGEMRERPLGFDFHSP